MTSLASLILTITIVSSTAVTMCSASDSDAADSYLQERNQLLVQERYLFIGGKLELTTKELEVNKVIMFEKASELLKGHKNITDFLPSQHFFEVRKRIVQSKVFSFIKKIPKGASLHTHLLAAVSVDFIMENITQRDNIYGCFLNGIFKLRFLGSADQDIGCDWKSLKEYRETDTNFDEWLRAQLSLEVENPRETYTSPDVLWKKFKGIFTTQYDMICYKPVFEEYIYQLLKELYVDNVMYTELRGTIMPLYELNGTVYDSKEFFRVFIATVEKFKKDYPEFLAARYIHSIYRGVTADVLQIGLDELIELKTTFPDFIAGFDFVGYEEEGKQLVDFHKILLEASKRLKFFFHAGETNWYGSTDLNLADAILLNTTRIGHGFGLAKHPVLVEIAKNRGMAIELCPISNQVLLLNDDPRNHPVVPLMASGFQVVISNDDPSAWGATGLSYDWYVVFMAMTSEDAGLGVLKQFALNSITYSTMTDDEKEYALENWSKSWDEFLDHILNSKSL